MDKTDIFYQDLKGYSYPDDVVDKWLDRWFLPYVEVAPKARILDLCCGDGVWSFGIKRRYPDVSVLGLDASMGAIDCARLRCPEHNMSTDSFLVHDLEIPLPVSCGFDLVLGRGLFIYNQHDFSSASVVGVMESWMTSLCIGGSFWGSYASKRDLFGTYTSAEKTRLPKNHEPRVSPLVDFKGGKYHHSISSFTQPFLLLNNVDVIHYSYELMSRHTVVCRRK